MQARLAAQPKVALAAVTHKLALEVFYTGDRRESVLRIGVAVLYLDRSAEEIEASKARKELAAATTAMRKRLPKDPAKLWDWLAEQDQRTVLALLAICAGHTVDTVESKRDPGSPTRHARQLAGALKLDMAEYWQPSADSYFSRVSKAQVLEAVTESAGPNARGTLSTLKKDDLAKAAEKKLKGSGWLPAILRTA